MKKDENKNKIEWKVPEKAHDADVKKAQTIIFSGVKGAVIAGAVILAFIFFLCHQIMPGKLSPEFWRKALTAYLIIPGIFMAMGYSVPYLSRNEEYSADDEGIHQGVTTYKWDFFEGYEVKNHPDLKDLKMIRLQRQPPAKAKLKGAFRPRMSRMMVFNMPDQGTQERLTSLIRKRLPKVEIADDTPLKLPEHFIIPTYAMWMGISIWAGHFVAGHPDIFLPLLVLMFFLGPGFIIGALSLWHYRDELKHLSDGDRIKVALYVLVVLYPLQSPLILKWKVLKLLVMLLNFSMPVNMILFTLIFAWVK